MVSGIMQHRPAGSGNLETRISPQTTSLQCNCLNVFSEIYFALSPLS